MAITGSTIRNPTGICMFCNSGIYGGDAVSTKDVCGISVGGHTSCIEGGAELDRTAMELIELLAESGDG